MQSRAVDAVDEEIAKEKAEAFGRSARALVAALEALRRFDAASTAGAPNVARRAALLAAAAERLTQVIVQREACGLRDPDYVCRFYAVPHEVVLRLGAGTRR